jgi:hypothetical protein
MPCFQLPSISKIAILGLFAFLVSYCMQKTEKSATTPSMKIIEYTSLIPDFVFSGDLTKLEDYSVRIYSKAGITFYSLGYTQDSTTIINESVSKRVYKRRRYVVKFGEADTGFLYDSTKGIIWSQVGLDSLFAGEFWYADRLQMESPGYITKGFAPFYSSNKDTVIRHFRKSRTTDPRTGAEIFLYYIKSDERFGLSLFPEMDSFKAELLVKVRVREDVLLGARSDSIVSFEMIISKRILTSPVKHELELFEGFLAGNKDIGFH